MKSAAITIERYAELRAEIDAGEHQDVVLRRADLADEIFAQAQREWLQVMGEEAARGRLKLSRHYQGAYRAHRPANFGDPIPEAAPDLSAAYETGTANVFELQAVVPFLDKDEMEAAKALASPQRVAQAEPVDPLPEEAPSTDEVPEEEDGLTAAAKVVPDAFATSAIDLSKLGPILPFGEAAVESEPNEATEPDASSLHAPPPVSVVPVSVAAPSVPLPPQSAPPSSMAHQTRALPMFAPPDDEALPFDEQAPASMPASASPSELQIAAALRGETTGLQGLADLAADVLAETAGQKAPDVTALSLSVEQHAALQLELETYPNHRAQVLARYAVADEASLKALDEQMYTVLGSDPAKLAAWRAAREAYARQLSSR
jgi:hypothetical protein